MDDQIDNVDVDTTQTDADVEETEKETETTEQTEKPAKAPESPEAKRARLERQLEQHNKKYGFGAKKEEQPSSPTSDLDYGQRAYLATTLGIKGSAELALVREYLKNGKTIDDLVDSRHFKNDLQDLRDAADSKAATPTSTKRSGASNANDLDLALAKYEETQELPKEFELRAKVLEALDRKHSDNTPPWLR